MWEAATVPTKESHPFFIKNPKLSSKMDHLRVERKIIYIQSILIHSTLQFHFNTYIAYIYSRYNSDSMVHYKEYLYIMQYGQFSSARLVDLNVFRKKYISALGIFNIYIYIYFTYIYIYKNKCF